MGLCKTHHQKTHEIEVIHDQVLGLEPELPILNEMASVKDRSLHVRGVPNWIFQLYFLTILHQRHKLDRPICGEF